MKSPWRKIKTIDAKPKKKSYKPKFGFKSLKKVYKKVKWI